MGEASAQAQSLKNPITSGSKMMTADGHTVYLLVDKTAAAGQGAVVGMLKVLNAQSLNCCYQNFEKRIFIHIRLQIG